MRQPLIYKEKVGINTKIKSIEN